MTYTHSRPMHGGGSGAAAQLDKNPNATNNMEAATYEKDFLVLCSGSLMVIYLRIIEDPF